MLWAVTIALLLSLAIYLSIAGWARERRVEREAFYEQEIVRRMLEKDGSTTAEVASWLRERDERRVHGKRHSLKLAAYVCCGMGLGMLAGLHFISLDHQYWTLGFIPLLTGIALAMFVNRNQ